MKPKHNSLQIGRLAHQTVAIVFAILSITAFGWAGENTVFTFNGNDGSNPFSTLVMDSAGNFYGVTSSGGGNTACFGNSCGVVFKLTPNSSGHWTETVLHRFAGGGDGYYPNFLTIDAAGNLYGTTIYGGGNGGQCNGGTGCGIVFKLTPRTTGPWPETVLYRFSGNDGAQPNGLAFDAHGNLYGTASTSSGNGTCGNIGDDCGVLFQLTPAAIGTWTLTPLHTFLLDVTSDGSGPNGLTFGPDGNIYGTTQGGGAYYQGTVFELIAGTGGWSFSLIHSFGGSGDGWYPTNGVTLDAQGNIYGTTARGGVSSGAGLVFELSPSAGGWAENILYTFQLGAGGWDPDSSLVFDTAGNLYGATYYGTGSSQCPNGCGAIFKLTPTGPGAWTESVAIRFVQQNGAHPVAGLVSDGAGNLYGTAKWGGTTNNGVVFELVP